MLAADHGNRAQYSTSTKFALRRATSIPGSLYGRTLHCAGLKALADASVSQFFSYLGEQVEAAPPAPVPTQWTKDEATAAE